MVLPGQGRVSYSLLVAYHVLMTKICRFDDSCHRMRLSYECLRAINLNLNPGWRIGARNILPFFVFRIVSRSTLLTDSRLTCIHNIYSVDDSFLQRAISSIPKQSILLIEDIDCAFSSREEGDEAHNPPMAPEYSAMVTPYGPRRKSAVTLSGLLNVIDGVGSEEGKLFFATVSRSSLDRS